MTIDAHQHFWNYDPQRHQWISDHLSMLHRNFLPADLEPVLQANDVAGCIAVQTDQTEEETLFLLGLANRHDFIKGVVGWVDLQLPAIAGRLSYFSQYNHLKGFRHILQAETQRDLFLQQPFLDGISLLEQYHFTYDILILPDQLPYLPALISRFPNQRFVIDHLAKPSIRTGAYQPWKKDIQKVAAYGNVYCKVSGMVTEATPGNWKDSDFVPYIETVLEAFGIERLMYGSDWPVCLAEADYTNVINLTRSYFHTFSEEEQLMFFYRNAVDFYHLAPPVNKH